MCKKMRMTLLTCITAVILPLAGSHVRAVEKLAGPQGAASSDSEKLAEAKRLGLEGKRLYQEGKFQQALPLVAQALAIKEKILGQNHRSVATTLYSLGSLYLATNDLDLARKHYNRALKICEKISSANLPDDSKEVDVVAVLEGLAECSEREVDWGKAESFHQRVLQLRQAKLGVQHTDVGQTWLNLAIIQIEKKSHEKAEQSIQQALAVFEKSLGKTHLKYAEALDTYCWLLYQSGRDAEANSKAELVNEIVFNNATDKSAPLEFYWRSFRGRQAKQKSWQFDSGGGTKVATLHHVLKVKVWVDENGTVTNLQTLSRPIKLTPQIEEGIKAFTFRPATVNGKPMKMVGVYFRYVAQDIFFSVR